MNTATGEMVKFLESAGMIERENGQIEKAQIKMANFMKAIPEQYVGMLQGMNRKDRREWYRKNKKMFGEVKR